MKKSASTRNQNASTWMVAVAVIPACIFFSFMSNYALSLQLSERPTKPIQIVVEQPAIVLKVDSSLSLSTLKKLVHIPLFYMPKPFSPERCISSTLPSPFGTEGWRVTSGPFFLVQDLSPKKRNNE